MNSKSYPTASTATAARSTVTEIRTAIAEAEAWKEAEDRRW
jgi:hypothetical protein